MIKRLLIANRGEIACRIARTAHRLGIATVAVFSTADRHALHVEAAQAAVCIGAAPAENSYLSIEAILHAARETGADAIHPGYGFLSESAAFAEACTAAGLIFVGPSPEAMRTLGGKATAKALARSVGVPVVPGYDGAQQDVVTLRAEALGIGFPMLIKAVAGGGGRGMRRVDRIEDFDAALASAVREAQSAFGDRRVILEKLVVSPRHIEIQVFGDQHGNTVHLFERECTLQRRHQKVVEEAPAAGMSTRLRAKLANAAVTLARAARYDGAGTVEFLVEGGSLSQTASWYFIEMNTRLQVEHPVTEEVTGLDLVEWQLRVASGEPLPLSQSAITFKGHAVEARLCAEDPSDAFRPQTGPIVAWQEPVGQGIRIDSGFAAGRTIPPDYDSLLAKIICHSATREGAIDKTIAALKEFLVAGPRTNAAFLSHLIATTEFATATMDTGFIDRNLSWLAQHATDTKAVAAGVLALLRAQSQPQTPSPDFFDPWAAMDGFQLGGLRSAKWTFRIDGKPSEVAATWNEGGLCLQVEGQSIDEQQASAAMVVRSGKTAYVLSGLMQSIVSFPDHAKGHDDNDTAGRIEAPITGRVAAVHVSVGDKVARGAIVAVVEAMKMEHIIKAPKDGTIATVEVRSGDQIAAGRSIATYAGDENA